MNRRRRSIWTEPLEPFLLRLPFASVIVQLFAVAGAVGIHYLFIYSAITGNMIGRNAWTPVNGRDAAPVLHSIYLFGVGAAAISIDLWAFNKFVGNRKKK